MIVCGILAASVWLALQSAALGSASRLDAEGLSLLDRGQVSEAEARFRKALEIVSRGCVSAKDLVNRVEPLANLLQVMQHLMSHNGHLKTAILP